MGCKICGVEFAPLSVPLQRRLQTLAALFAVLLYLSMFLTVPFFIYLLLWTSYYWVAVLYAAWIWYDRNTSSRGGRRSEWFIKCLPHLKYLREYFPLDLVKTADLDLNEKYVMGYHPHGMMGCGLYNIFTNVTGFRDKFPGITPFPVSLKLAYLIPFFRELVLAAGACDASKESLEYVLRSKGNAVVILLGGVKEMFDAVPYTYSNKTLLVLKTRQGFIKLALRTGAHLVPCFTFGENQLYRPLLNNRPGTRLRKIQRFALKHFNVQLLPFTGRGLFNYTFGLIPQRHPLVTVVGRPIFVEKDEDPSQEKVSALHERYMMELRTLFDEHKAKYGYDSQTLEFIE